MPSSWLYKYENIFILIRVLQACSKIQDVFAELIWIWDDRDPFRAVDIQQRAIGMASLSGS